jgi:TolB-like protein
VVERELVAAPAEYAGPAVARKDVLTHLGRYRRAFVVAAECPVGLKGMVADVHQVATGNFKP